MRLLLYPEKKGSRQTGRNERLLDRQMQEGEARKARLEFVLTPHSKRRVSIAVATRLTPKMSNIEVYLQDESHGNLELST